MRKRIFAVIAMVMLALIFSSCGTPPEKEKNLAEKAFKGAGIGKDCDKENYLAAEELLNKAREEWNGKNWKKAKQLFMKVEKKSKAVSDYYRTHPDECMPKEEKVEEDDVDTEDDANVTEEDVKDPTKDPDMDFPVIHFEFNEYTVLSEDLSKLETMASWMQNFENVSIRIEGHADERGSIDYNMSLGEKRAREVRKQLIQLGISKSRMKIISYGEENPVDSGNNESAWSENRRAELKRIN